MFSVESGGYTPEEVQNPRSPEPGKAERRPNIKRALALALSLLALPIPGKAAESEPTSVVEKGGDNFSTTAYAFSREALPRHYLQAAGSDWERISSKAIYDHLIDWCKQPDTGAIVYVSKFMSAQRMAYPKDQAEFHHRVFAQALEKNLAELDQFSQKFNIDLNTLKKLETDIVSNLENRGVIKPMPGVKNDQVVAQLTVEDCIFVVTMAADKLELPKAIQQEFCNDFAQYIVISASGMAGAIRYAQEEKKN